MFVRRDLELNFWHVKPRELRVRLGEREDAENAGVGLHRLYVHCSVYCTTELGRYIITRRRLRCPRVLVPSLPYL